jgi:hypothetical protein
VSSARPAKGGAARYERVLARLRRICLGLPDTTEVVAWGHPTFRVGKKIFVGFGGDDERLEMGFKADGLEQRELVETEPAIYSVAKYVGQHGWVTMRLDGAVDWKSVERHVIESWRRIAGPRKAAKLDRGG